VFISCILKGVEKLNWHTAFLLQITLLQNGCEGEGFSREKVFNEWRARVLKVRLRAPFGCETCQCGNRCLFESFNDFLIYIGGWSVFKNKELTLPVFSHFLDQISINSRSKSKRVDSCLVRKPRNKLTSSFGIINLSISQNKHVSRKIWINQCTIEDSLHWG